MSILLSSKQGTMKKLIGFLTIALAAGIAEAQTPSASPAAQANSGITATGVIGEVKSIDAAAKQLLVKTDSGALVTVAISDKTAYKRLAPGEKTLDKATVITLAEIGEGDRVWARGRVAADQKSVPAQQVIQMTKADIAKKQEHERAEWHSRGVLGIISALNPTSKEITVSARSLAGTPQAVIIPVTDKVIMRRYPPDEIPKFSAARLSTFEELKVGDQLRALGNKSADGTHLAAEEVVSGSFRIAGGIVTAIDATTGEVKINDLQTKKPLTIIVKPDSVLRRFTGAMMMGMGPGGAPGGAGSARTGGAPGTPGPGTQGQGPRPQGGGGPGGPQGGGMRGGGAGMNMADLLERLPTISINDLKVGDTVIMSSTQGSDPTRLTAISLVTGVEPLLAMMSARPQAGGGQPRPAADLNGSFGGMFGGVGLP